MRKQDRARRARRLASAVGERLSYANVVATLALVVALGTGGAYAASKIGPKDIRKNAVRSKHIKNGQVRGADVSPKTVKSRLGIFASGNVFLDGTADGAERVLARSGPIRLVFRCTTPDAQSAIILRSTGASGRIMGVQYGFGGVGNLNNLSFSSGTLLVGAASGAIGPNGASFTATVGNSVLTGEAKASFVSPTRCEASFQGLAG